MSKSVTAAFCPPDIASEFDIVASYFFQIDKEYDQNLLRFCEEIWDDYKLLHSLQFHFIRLGQLEILVPNDQASPPVAVDSRFGWLSPYKYSSYDLPLIPWQTEEELSSSKDKLVEIVLASPSSKFVPMYLKYKDFYWALFKTRFDNFWAHTGETTLPASCVCTLSFKRDYHSMMKACRDLPPKFKLPKNNDGAFYVPLSVEDLIDAVDFLHDWTTKLKMPDGMVAHHQLTILHMFVEPLRLKVKLEMAIRPSLSPQEKTISSEVVKKWSDLCDVVFSAYIVALGFGNSAHNFAEYLRAWDDFTQGKLKYILDEFTISDCAACLGMLKIPGKRTCNYPEDVVQQVCTPKTLTVDQVEKCEEVFRSIGAVIKMEGGQRLLSLNAESIAAGILDSICEGLKARLSEKRLEVLGRKEKHLSSLIQQQAT